MDIVSESSVAKIAEAAKQASAGLAAMTGEQRNKALLAIADALAANADNIVAENLADLDHAQKAVQFGELKDSLYQRLKLDKTKLMGTIAGIRQIVSMPDPLGTVTLARELDDNLKLYRVTSPIGVVCVIFEARPEAMPQILSLCLKTGNALILKGGSEAEQSNRILFNTMNMAAIDAGVPPGAFALIKTRANVDELLKAEGLVDLIIPRGSNDLVRYIQSNTRIPVLGHADGICHVYVDDEAELNKAQAIVIDSKTQYPSACNSAETLLIHKSILLEFLPRICIALQEKGVELRLDKACEHELKKNPTALLNLKNVHPACEKDWSTEYCELILSIKAVDSMDEAINHINKYGSGHTEAMVSENKAKFQQFFSQVNSAGVYLNASTRFADGYRYGFGAEVGISTAKMHPRGPVGVEGLLSYKYKLIGDGQIVANYSGPKARPFKHTDLNN